MRPYHFTKPKLSRSRTARCVYPYPLSDRDADLGEKKERQQADLALYWRRGFEARKHIKHRGAA